MNWQTAPLHASGNYYDCLQVSHEATPEELTRAFRRLAKRYHPDLAPKWVRDSRFFHRLREAYEALSDPASRRLYDESLARRNRQKFGNGLGSAVPKSRPAGRSGPWQGGPRPGQFAHHAAYDVDVVVQISLKKAIRGGMQKVRLKRLADGGCPLRADFVTIHVPALCLRGHRIQVPFYGRTERSRLRAGHLKVKIEYRKDSEFRQIGADLHTILELNPWDTALGGSFPVAGPEGPVLCQIPAGTRHWQSIRIRGVGLPREGGGRGDLMVCVKIRAVAALDPEQRRLWAALRQAHAR